MNRDDIIRMALEQGLPETETEGVFIVNSDDLGRMLAAEREACAKVCESLEIPPTVVGAHPDYLTGKHMAVLLCAAAIRKRMK